MRSAFAPRRCTAIATGCGRSGSTTTRRGRTPIHSSRRTVAAARGCRSSTASLVELPLTSAAGPHAVRDPGPARTRRRGLQKAEFLRARGGMAMIDTHPDYLIDETDLPRVRPVPRSLRRRPHGVAAHCRARSALGGAGGRRRGSSTTARRWQHRRPGVLTRAGSYSRGEPGESQRPGAIVVGGDYQGLGIVRSLGRRGVEVVVIDDEHSISRHSRYVAGSYRFRDLRTDEQTVGALLGSRRAPGRARAGSCIPRARRRSLLCPATGRSCSSTFAFPTPDWSVTQWAWDKRNTYRRAAELGIPVPRTWRVSSEDELDTVDGEPPYVIKPAIKEHFFYATKCKAWRADSRDGAGRSASARRRSWSAPRRSSSRS